MIFELVPSRQFEPYLLRSHVIRTSSVAQDASLFGEREAEKRKGCSEQGHIVYFNRARFKPFHIPEWFI